MANIDDIAIQYCFRVSFGLFGQGVRYWEVHIGESKLAVGSQTDEEMMIFYECKIFFRFCSFFK